MINGKDHITLKFQAAPYSTAGAVYFVRLVTAENTDKK